VCFETLHLSPNKKHTFKAKELTDETAESYMFFDKKQNVNVSVAKYFGQAYEELQHPSLPLLNGGTPRKPRCFPPEVCQVVAGQKVLRTLSDVQRNLLPQFCTSRPDTSKGLITYCANKLANFQSDPTARAFGVEVAKQMLEVEGRVLPPPDLEGTVENQVQATMKISPDNGAWSPKQLGFRSPATLHSWAAVFVRGGASGNADKAVPAFIKQLSRKLYACGLNGNALANAAGDWSHQRPPVVDFPVGHLSEGIDTIEAAMAVAASRAESKYQHPCQLLLVILPEKRTPLYYDVKRASDQVLGVPSQCIAASHLEMQEPHHKGANVANPSYVANVAMKVNAKLGGLNAIIGRGIPEIIHEPDGERLRLEYQKWLELPEVEQRHAPRPKTPPSPWPCLPCMEEACMIFGVDVTHPAAGASRDEPSVAAVVCSMDSFACQVLCTLSRSTGEE